jgi:cadmium resistance protein CadD (predicted permease)
MGSLVAASLLLAHGATRLPPIGVRLLGGIPQLLGLYKAVQVWRARTPYEEHPAGAGEGLLSIAAVTIASGGDNVAAYVPAFAAGDDGIAVYGPLFMGMTLVWCVGSRMLVRHPVVQAGIERAGSWLTPAVLVFVGILILLG